MAARKMKQKMALFGFVGVSGLRDLTTSAATAKARSPMMNACGLFSSSGVSSRLRNLTTAASPIDSSSSPDAVDIEVRKIWMAVHRSCLLHEFSEKGFDTLEDAYILFDLMLASEEFHWPEHFIYVLTGVARMNRRHPETIVSLFNRMCSRGIPVSKYTLCIVVSAFCRMGRLDYAFSVLGSFFKHGFAPEEFTYSILMNGLIKHDQNAQAVELFDKLMIPKGWVSPDENMYATAMRAYIKMDDWAAAMQIFRRIPAGDSVVVPYNTIICSLCEAGRVDDAMAVYCNVWKGRAIPDRPVFNCLIKELAYLERWKDVKKMLEEMAWPGMPEYKEDVPCWYEEEEEFKVEVRDLSTFHVLVEAYWNKLGISWRKLRMILVSPWAQKNTSSFLFTSFLKADGYSNDRIAHPEIEEEVVNFMNRMNVKDGILFKADLVLKMMTLAGVKPDVVTYNMLLDDYFSYMCRGEAMELFNVMRMSQVIPPDAVSYNIIVEGCCRLYQIDEGLKLFREMHQKGFKPDAGTYNTLLTGLLLRDGRSTEAEGIFHEMVRMGISIDMSTNSMLFNGVLHDNFQLPVNNQGVDNDAPERTGGLLNKWVKQNVCDDYLFDEAEELMLETHNFWARHRVGEYHKTCFEAVGNLLEKKKESRRKKDA